MSRAAVYAISRRTFFRSVGVSLGIFAFIGCFPKANNFEADTEEAEPSNWTRVVATELNPKFVADAHEKKVGLLELSHDGKALLSSGSAGDDYQIACWDICTGKLSRRWSKDQSHGTKSFSWARGDAMFAAGSLAEILVGDVKNGQELQAIEHVFEVTIDREKVDLPVSINDVCFYLNGKSLAAIGGCYEGHTPEELKMPLTRGGYTVNLWDLLTKKRTRIEHAETPPAGFITHNLSISPDGKLLVFRRTDAFVSESRIAFFDLPSGKKLGEIDSLPGFRTRAVFEPQGELLAVGGGSSGKPTGIALIDVKTRKRQRSLAENYIVGQMAFSKDGKSILGRTFNRGQPKNFTELAVWNIADGKKTAHYRIEDEGVSCTAISLEARIVITGHEDGRLKLWELP